MPTLGAAGHVEVLEVLEEDERYLSASQYLVRHLRTSRTAYATDDELLDVLAKAPFHPSTSHQPPGRCRRHRPLAVALTPV